MKKIVVNKLLFPLKKLLSLFLVLMHRLHIPNMIRSLKRNHTAVFRDPKAILKKCGPDLSPDLLKRPKSVLYNENSAKFNGHDTAAEIAECRKVGITLASQRISR